MTAARSAAYFTRPTLIGHFITSNPFSQYFTNIHSEKLISLYSSSFIFPFLREDHIGLCIATPLRMPLDVEYLSRQYVIFSHHHF
jgi:hypothetical protein